MHDRNILPVPYDLTHDTPATVHRFVMLARYRRQMFERRRSPLCRVIARRVPRRRSHRRRARRPARSADDGDGPEKALHQRTESGPAPRPVRALFLVEESTSNATDSDTAGIYRPQERGSLGGSQPPGRVITSHQRTTSEVLHAPA